MVLKDDTDKCLQCTIVGDSLVGKSTLVQKFSREGREENLDYEHTVFDNAAGTLHFKLVDEVKVHSLYDIIIFISSVCFFLVVYCPILQGKLIRELNLILFK